MPDIQNLININETFNISLGELVKEDNLVKNKIIAESFSRSCIFGSIVFSNLS